jgi:hypothetical protein
MIDANVSLASPEDSHRDMVEKLAEKFSLSRKQGIALEEYKAASGPDYVLKQAEIVRFEPRDHVARSFVARFARRLATP